MRKNANEGKNKAKVKSEKTQMKAKKYESQMQNNANMAKKRDIQKRKRSNEGEKNAKAKCETTRTKAKKNANKGKKTRKSNAKQRK